MDWKIATSLAVAALAWIVQQYATIALENRKLKQQQYEYLVTSLSGLTVSSLDREKTQRFIETDRLLWIYAPDHVVRASSRFIDTLDAARFSNEEREEALKALMVALRKDIFNPWPLTTLWTRLRPFDFQLRGPGDAWKRTGRP